MPEVSLLPFSVPPPGDISLQASIERGKERIRLAFLLRGALHDLFLPQLGKVARRDNLWQSTCFEVFWRRATENRYWELNLSPTGAWNVYAFSDYRKDMRQAEGVPPPEIRVEHGIDRFRLDAELDLGGLCLGNSPLRIGISAVLAHPEALLTYWALRHPENKPDFHSPRNFLLSL
ncbi:DOMON-like domain-containing protein [Thiovibrio sp. JS02]